MVKGKFDLMELRVNSIVVKIIVLICLWRLAIGFVLKVFSVDFNRVKDIDKFVKRLFVWKCFCRVVIVLLIIVVLKLNRNFFRVVIFEISRINLMLVVDWEGEEEGFM